MRMGSASYSTTYNTLFYPLFSPQQIMYKSKEDKADAELREVLTKSCTENGDGTLTWSRRPKSNTLTTNGPSTPAPHFNNKAATLGPGSPLVDGDDEILDCLVKTATRAPDSRIAPRDRKRNSARYSDRKSCKKLEFCFGCN